MSKNLKSILASFLEEIWNKGNLANLDNYLETGPGFSYEIKNDPGDPWDGQTIDKQTFKERVAYSRNSFPDLRFDSLEMVEENNTVAMRWNMSGTHKSNLPNLPATNKTFFITGITFYYFNNGKISGHSQSFDQLGFLAQIGMLKLNTAL